MTSKYIRYAIPVALSALLMGACAKNDNTTASDTLAQDSLNKDLALANKDTTSQPKLQDVPSNTSTPTTAGGNTAPRSTTHRSTSSSTSHSTSSTRPSSSTSSSSSSSSGTGAAPAGPKMGTIAAGTAMTARASSSICTNTNKVGDQFTATLTESVHGADGAVIPAGAVATLQITKLDRQENANDKIHMNFRLVSISWSGHTYTPEATVAANEITKVKNQPKSKDVQKVVGGAAIGAIIGKVIGKSTKGAVIGAATGAAAGAATAAATANYEGCVNAGSNLTITLTSATQVYM